MNESDTEIIKSILEQSSFIQSTSAESSDILLINTCAIRENAE
jgi:tRNA-2-methylthio-N6-dimethylallyladenosine synthase